MMSPEISRRTFIALAGAVTAGMAPGHTAAAPSRRIPIYVFSKHLQWLEGEVCTQTAREIGFDGIELTLRKGGHVEPARVEDDLPRFLEASRKAGVKTDIAATDIWDVNDPLNARVLQAMSKAGFTSYRLQYQAYQEGKPIQAQLDELRPAIRDLVQANKELGLTAVWQNHSGGRYIGGVVWDVYDLIRQEDPRYIGFSFDIGHAVVEGGNIWRTNTLLTLPRAYSIVAKDFFWEKAAAGWRIRWCPVGEGMIPLTEWFAVVAASSFNGPLSVQFPYQIEPKSGKADYTSWIAEQKKDVQTLRKLLGDAGLQ